MKTYPHVAAMIFNTPLMIKRAKLHAIIRAVAPKIGASAYDFGDYEDDDAPMRPDPMMPVDGITTIPVYGTLVKRCVGMDAESGLTSYESLSCQIMDAATNPQCKAILLDIDSYGGECAGAFDLSDLIYQARQSIPIYGIANSNALSAGYAIGSACEKLLVTQDGSVGSVGVIAEHCDQSEYDSKLGVKYTPITFGAHKNDFSSHAPLSADALAELQADVDRLGDMFVGLVARNRGLSAEAVLGTQAAIYAGQEAVSIGLADQVGTRSDAVALLQSRISNRRLIAMPGQSLSAASASAAAISPQEGTIVSDLNTRADANSGTPPNPGEQQPVVSPPVVAPNAAPAQPQRNMTAQEMEECRFLCGLTGNPARYFDFMDRNLSLTAVRRELAAKKAEPSEQNPELQTMAFAAAPQPKPASLLDACKRRVEQARGVRN